MPTPRSSRPPAVFSRTGSFERTTTLRSPICRRKATRATTSSVRKEPAAPSPEEAGRKLRAALESAGKNGQHSAEARVHALRRRPCSSGDQGDGSSLRAVFSLTSLPNALADAAECSARAAGARLRIRMPLELRGRLRHDDALQDAGRRSASPASAMAEGRQRVAGHGYGVELP